MSAACEWKEVVINRVVRVRFLEKAGVSRECRGQPSEPGGIQERAFRIGGQPWGVPGGAPGRLGWGKPEQRKQGRAVGMEVGEVSDTSSRMLGTLLSMRITVVTTVWLLH